MKVSTPVIGMPPRVEVVVGPSRVVGIKWPVLSGLLTIDAIVVVLVRAVEGNLAMPYYQHAVHISVLPSGKISIQGGQFFRFESKRCRGGNRPGPRWP